MLIVEFVFNKNNVTCKTMMRWCKMRVLGWHMFGDIYKRKLKYG